MKNFDTKKAPEGLGDLIAKITQRLGIAKIAEDVAHLVGKKDCGCNKRREKLNEVVPFKKKKNATKRVKK